MSRSVAEAVHAARVNQDYAALVSAIPYARFLGVELERIDGQLRARLPFRDMLIGNPRLPALHGGATAAFMENTAMLHLLLELNEPRVPKSIDFSIDYLSPARPLDTYAQCTISRAGSRVAQTAISCWQSNPDKPIAIARSHFLLAAPQ